MKTEKYIVAFIDILGFKKMIEEFDEGKQPNLLNDIAAVVDSVSSFLREEPNYQTEDFNKWKQRLVVKSFSDCFCIAIPFEYRALDFNTHIKLFYQHVALFQVAFFQKGFLVRGGISVGSFFHNENIIFSGGLVSAYKLESKRARFPRILVSEIFLEEVRNLKTAYKKSMFIKEFSEVFLNPFNYALIDSREANIEKKRIEDLLPGDGFIGGDFEVSASKEKEEIIDNIKTQMKKHLQTKESTEIIEKYEWVIDLCNFQQNINTDRFHDYL